MSETKMSSCVFRWDKPGIPQKGWVFEHIEDMEEPCFQCEMCSNPRVRYVHTMTHPEYPSPLRVGCVCAGHLEDDYEAPRERERVLKNVAERRKRFTIRHGQARDRWAEGIDWNRSSKGSYVRTDQGRQIVVFASPRHPGKWGAVVDSEFSPFSYQTARLAMLDVFDRLYNLPYLLARLKDDPGEKIDLPRAKTRKRRRYQFYDMSDYEYNDEYEDEDEDEDEDDYEDGYDYEDDYEDD